MFYVLFKVIHSFSYFYKNPTEIYNPLILPPFEIFIKFYFYYEIENRFLNYANKTWIVKTEIKLLSILR